MAEWCIRDALGIEDRPKKAPHDKHDTHDELHGVLQALLNDEDLVTGNLDMFVPRDDLTPLWWPLERNPPWTPAERRRVLLMRIRQRLPDGVPVPPVAASDREGVQHVKSSLARNAPKTVNNVLTVLNTLLRTAVEWRVIDSMPCSIRLLKVAKPSASFHDFEDFERLVDGARRDSETAHLITLLGGEAGLRCGEMMALQWDEVDLAKRQLCVARSDWKGHVTAPKGGRLRYVPLTKRLTDALRAARHLRGPRVLCDEGGTALTQKVVQDIVRRAARRAKVRPGVHILRHTFCSHLSMRGAPALAIQELAGHEDIRTTERYMHLSPAAVESAIRLLETRANGQVFGEMVEAAGTER